jgi:hypothetical protein
VTDAPPTRGPARRGPAHRRRNNLIILVVLLAGLVIGMALVVFGGDDGGDTADGPVLTGEERPQDLDDPDAATTDARGVLPLDDVEFTVDGIEAFTGIVVPDDGEEFLTGRLDNDRQLDITFLFPVDGEAAFLESSQLPEPVEGQRVVLHGSALWELNPPEGVEIRGATDTFGEVRRAFELVEEQPGVLRARIVITTA